MGTRIPSARQAASSRDDALIVFVKAPSSGMPKSRIARVLGAEAASAVYRCLVERLFRNLRPLAGIQLCYTPQDAAEEIRVWLRPGWTIRPQIRGDLGARMRGAFEGAFASGARRVCVIGSDCPLVTAADIRQAWRRLERHDVVLGPAQDGGYWLIALRRPQPYLLTGIDWSTSAVLLQTIARASELGLRVACLRHLRDIDTLADWQWFERHARTRTVVQRRR
jgi:rSAM/selenodomain-associated transferase 1